MLGAVVFGVLAALDWVALLLLAARRSSRRRHPPYSPLSGVPNWTLGVFCGPFLLLLPLISCISTVAAAPLVW